VADMLDKLVNYARTQPLSDIHLHSNAPIALRVHGGIHMIKEDVISRDDIDLFLSQIMDDEDAAIWKETGDLDLAATRGGLRFRVNAYQTINGPNVVLRKIEESAPPIETLGLPPAIMNVTHEKNGLVLITGPTGSGKSTTLASVIDRINTERDENIITIEDPIEFIHNSKKSIVSQREVGKQTKSFGSALKASLREDPDVILIGEMRDLETVSLALTAAETGHLVFGTLHTNGAASSINRILDVFPPQQQAQARSQLSQSLRLVATQRLMKRKDGGGRVAAFEIMCNNTAVANLIRENKIFQIDHAIQTGKQQGMMMMADSINDLIVKGMIDSDET
jgi:twitching motility protein PilT